MIAGIKLPNFMSGMDENILIEKIGSRMSPKSIECTMFALVISTQNVGAFIGSQLGALLSYLFGISASDFPNLWLLIFLSQISMVCLLPMLKCIDFEKAIYVSERKSLSLVNSLNVSREITITLSHSFKCQRVSNCIKQMAIQDNINSTSILDFD